MIYAKFFGLALATALISQTPGLAADAERWYTPELVTTGEDLFETKCSRCHGIDAEGVPDWRELDDEGLFPPPPLDGTAYTWRHDLDQLREQIRQGGQGRSEMPAFAAKLDRDNIDALIAYIQSRWSDDIYQAWHSRQLKQAARSVDEDDVAQDPGSYWLKRHLRPARIIPGEPRKTPLRGITEVRVDDRVLYLSEDGRYAFTGHMIDLVDGTDLTRSNQRQATLTSLKNFPADDMLVFPAQGEASSQLTVFTDTSCGYCRKFHLEVAQLTSNGVTVRYIPYPRRGLEGANYTRLKSIWCAENPLDSLERYFATRELPNPNLTTCNRSQALEKGYRIGNEIGIRGTPLIVLDNGDTLRGYKSATEIFSRLSE